MMTLDFIFEPSLRLLGSWILWVSILWHNYHQQGLEDELIVLRIVVTWAMRLKISRKANFQFLINEVILKINKGQYGPNTYQKSMQKNCVQILNERKKIQTSRAFMITLNQAKSVMISSECKQKKFCQFWKFFFKKNLIFCLLYQKWRKLIWI